MAYERAGAVTQSSLVQAGFGTVFVSLAEQMTALGQYRPITYESLGLIPHSQFLVLPCLGSTISLKASKKLNRL